MQSEGEKATNKLKLLPQSQKAAHGRNKIVQVSPRKAEKIQPRQEAPLRQITLLSNDQVIRFLKRACDGYIPIL